MRTCLALIAALAFALPSHAADDALTPQQTQQFERLVREYLMRNPEVIIEAMQGYEAKKAAAQAEAQRAAVRALAGELLRDPNSFVGGNPQGDVTVVEFFDYRCGYCKQAKPQLDAALRQDGNVRVIYKEFPILGPDSVAASRVAIATLLTQPAKYRPLHEALMASKGALPEATALQIAAETGVDVARVRATLKDPRIDAIIAANRDLAEKLDIQGTPAFIIGDDLLAGAAPTERFLAAFASARRK